MKIRAILNRDGGTLRTMDLDAFCDHARAIFSEHGHVLDCRVVAGKAVAAELSAAATDDAVDAIIAGGGDGTISSAAAVAFSSGKPLGVLPAGTMNLFARALGMRLDLYEALNGLAGGSVERVDIATANGRPFVHQFGVGIHARLVRIRDGMHYGSRVGKMLASLRAILAAAVNPPRFEVELNAPTGPEKRFASGIAISNNPLGDGPVPVAAQLDSGKLGVYVADSLTTTELLNLVVDVMIGHWRDNERVSELVTPEVTLRFPTRRKGQHAVIDGELTPLDASVTLKVHALGLAIIRPMP